MLGMFSSRIVVADADAADRVAVELTRNTLIAYPEANVYATGVEAWPGLRSFLADDAQRFGFDSDPSRGYWDLYIAGDRGESVVSQAVRMALVLPGAGESAVADRRVELVVGKPEGEVIVVPGTARTVNGAHVLTAETFGRLKRAEQIVRRRPVRALILSGWNGRDERSSSEAAQMLDAWHGRQVPIILDEAARTTAENALWSASFAIALGGVRTVRVVTSWVSAPRLGVAILAAFRNKKVRLRMSIVWGRTQAASWRPAFEGLLHLRRHLRIGRALLTKGPRSPDAQL